MDVEGIPQTKKERKQSREREREFQVEETILLGQTVHEIMAIPIPLEL